MKEDTPHVELGASAGRLGGVFGRVRQRRQVSVGAAVTVGLCRLLVRVPVSTSSAAVTVAVSATAVAVTVRAVLSKQAQCNSASCDKGSPYFTF